MSVSFCCKSKFQSDPKNTIDSLSYMSVNTDVLTHFNLFLGPAVFARRKLSKCMKWT